MRLYQQIAQSLAELWQPRWVRAEQPAIAATREVAWYRLAAEAPLLTRAYR
jgi:hypothetical protein